MNCGNCHYCMEDHNGPYCVITFKQVYYGASCNLNPLDYEKYDVERMGVLKANDEKWNAGLSGGNR